MGDLLDTAISAVFDDCLVSDDVFIDVVFVGLSILIVMHFPVACVSLRVFLVCLWQLGAWLRIALDCWCPSIRLLRGFTGENHR